MAGFIFYRGPSPIDGAPIVAIATLKSKNAKTGDMVQTWILREDASPLDAIASGEDQSICGNCTHRGRKGKKRTCYVDVGKAPMGVWKAYHRGQYIDLSDDPGTIAILLAQRIVRMGAYGDPAMVPVKQWRMLLSASAGRTGYTHAWRRMWAQALLKEYVMASVDNQAELDLRAAMGWRTFRVRTETEPLQSNEFACPASPEGGLRKQCITCKACDGADRPGKASAAIIVHGAMAKHFA
jgi:hypothetical protein